MMVSSTCGKEWTGLIRTLFNKKTSRSRDKSQFCNTGKCASQLLSYISFKSRVYFTCLLHNVQLLLCFLGNTSGDYQ